MPTDPKDTRNDQPRRPYEPPRIEESGEFERLVLACGHEPGGSGSCNPGKTGTPRS